MVLEPHLASPDDRGAPAVKVCGLTDPGEAAACAALGIWAVGLVFAQGSPRRVSLARAADIAAALPERTARVGVFVDADPARVVAAVDAAGLTHVQLHGAVEVERIRAATGGLPVIEGVRVDGPASLARADASDAEMVLLDAAVPGAHGGTGTRFDWDLLEREGRPARPFGVAGGLRPGNVAEAVTRLRPHLVDVSSGVESSPGRKDPDRVAAFVAAVAAAAAAVPSSPRPPEPVS